MKILYIAGIVSMMAFPAFAEKTLVDIKPEKVEMMPVAECKNIIRAMNSEKLPGVKPIVKPIPKPVKNQLVGTNIKKVYK